MKGIVSVLEQWVAGQNDLEVEFSEREDGSILQCYFEPELKGEIVKAWFDVNKENRVLILSMYPDGRIPESKRMTVASLLTWLNNEELAIGNFELSQRNGILRYRIGVPYGEMTMTPSALQELVACGIAALESYLSDIRATASGKPKTVAVETEQKALLLPDSSLSWSAYPRSVAIAEWGTAIRSLLENPDATMEDWQLVGPAIAIEYEHAEIGQELMRRLAADCQLPLKIIDTENIPKANDLPDQPMMLFIKPGSWQKYDCEEPEAITARNKVCELIRSFRPVCPVLCVTITNDLGALERSLRNPDSFNRQFQLSRLPYTQSGQAFIEMLGVSRCGNSILQSAAKVGKLLSYRYDTPAKQEMIALRLRRMFAKLGRPMEFLDLVEVHTRGIVESGSVDDQEEDKQRSAYHEAGHILTAVIDSQGRNIPEYSSIVSWGDSGGVVVDSVNYSIARNDAFTFADLRHAVRTSLGGRAAEELLYGAAGVSYGARGDLETCGRKSSRAFAKWGFAPSMDCRETSASNLAVVIGDPSITEQARLERQVRRFLAEEYAATLKMLEDHRPLLETITAMLMKSMVLDQDEVVCACRKAGVIA